MKVLLLAALSTGSTALECLHEIGGFEVMLITHDNTDASDYTPLFERVLEYGYEAQIIVDSLIFARRRIPTPITLVLNDGAAFANAEMFHPDIGICIGWSSLLRRGILNIPRLGWLGHHESMLPKRRGRAPIVWPIIHDAKSSGISFFWLTEGVDDGDIFCQAPFPIGPRDTIADLLTKANTVTRDLLLNDVLPNLKAGNFKRTPQDHSQATYCPRRTPSEGAIRWTDSAADIDRQVRALTHPYPGAFSWHKLRKVCIWLARPVAPPEHHPDRVYERAGTIVWVSADETRQWVATGSGLLEIYLPAGRMKVGDRFDGAQYYEL